MTIALLLATILIALFQLAILTQCGVVHRRLGLRVDGSTPARTAVSPDLVGKEVALPADSAILFASLSCSDCAAVLRGIVAEMADQVRVYLVDKPTPVSVAESLSRYPEFAFAAEPGEEAFSRLGTQHIPLFLKTDHNGRISFASTVENPSQLKRLITT